MQARERWHIKTIQVLEMVFEERLRQVARYGHNEHLKDGVGSESMWLIPLSDEKSEDIQIIFRREYEAFKEETGAPTWMHLVREEIAESFESDDDDRLVAELTQVAALCVSWIEKKVQERAALAQVL